MDKQKIAVVLLVVAILFSIGSLIVSFNADTGGSAPAGEQGVTVELVDGGDNNDAEGGTIGLTLEAPN